MYYVNYDQSPQHNERLLVATGTRLQVQVMLPTKGIFIMKLQQIRKLICSFSHISTSHHGETTYDDFLLKLLFPITSKQGQIHKDNIQNNIFKYEILVPIVSMVCPSSGSIETDSSSLKYFLSQKESLVPAMAQTWHRQDRHGSYNLNCSQMQHPC